MPQQSIACTRHRSQDQIVLETLFITTADARNAQERKKREPTGVHPLSASPYPHSTSASISESVVPSALASLSAWTMEGVLSARSMAPM
jgi:hypothetical protein